MTKPLSRYEKKVIKSAAADKVCQMMDLNNDDYLKLMKDTEDPDRFTVSMNISECYDYWMLYFINKVKKMEVTKK